MNEALKVSNENVLADCIASRRLASEVEKRARRFTPAPNGVLFREGDAPDGVYYLKAGKAMLTMSSDHKAVMMAVRADAGSLLGLPAVMGDRPYSLTAWAAASTEVYKLSRFDFDEMIQSDPKLSLDLLSILAAEVRSARVALGSFIAATPRVAKPKGEMQDVR
jgi:CRP-like cAMP-binding protein